jgi:hypothetical protein
MADDRNPYAFPALTEDDEYNGMTLRDWFAGQALTGMLSHQSAASIDGPASDIFVAGAAFQFADAMMVERERAK